MSSHRRAARRARNNDADPQTEEQPAHSVPLYRHITTESLLALNTEKLRLTQSDSPFKQPSTASSAIVPEHVPSAARNQWHRQQVGCELEGHVFEHPVEWARQQYHDPALFPTSSEIQKYLDNEDLYHIDTSTWTGLVANTVKAEKDLYPTILLIVRSILNSLMKTPPEKPTGGEESRSKDEGAGNPVGNAEVTDSGKSSERSKSEDEGSVGVVCDAEGNDKCLGRKVVEEEGASNDEAAPERARDTRTVVIGHNIRFMHLEDIGESEHWSCPDIVIRATGSSFEVPSNCSNILTAVGYTNIASFIEVKFSDSEAVDDLIEQCGVYIRQILIQQPNREFVRCMTISQNTCRIFHFDRDGVQYTPLIDTHNDAETFIRMILGLSSLDERVLGFDTAIKWEINPVTGRKNSGTVTVAVNETLRIPYRLCDVAPERRCYTIYGSGMTYWRAETIETNSKQTPSEVLVKISWRAEDRPAEHIFLRRAAGIPGIAKMLTRRGEERCTRALRGRQNDDPDWEAERIRTRLGSCIVLEAHGSCIDGFTSQRQLFGAVRDVVVALRSLFAKTGLVLREITPQNILLGRGDQLGVLIGLELAIPAKRPVQDVSSHPRSGEFLFMSVSSLNRCAPISLGEKLRHDRLDDLESVYYVLVVTMFEQMANGNSIVPTPHIFDDWENESPSLCMNSKIVHFTNSTMDAIQDVRQWWSDPAVNALAECFTVVRDMVKAKRALGPLRTPEQVRGMTNLINNADEFYTRMLVALDRALDDPALRLEPLLPVTPSYVKRYRPSGYYTPPSNAAQLRGSGLTAELRAAPDSPPSFGQSEAARLSFFSASGSKRSLAVLKGGEESEGENSDDEGEGGKNEADKDSTVDEEGLDGSPLRLRAKRARRSLAFGPL